MVQPPSPLPRPGEPLPRPPAERQTQPKQDADERNGRQTLPDVTEGINESGDPMPFEPTD